jgi:pimeloyl-ACP methyl ester carboxylesterase
MRLTSHHFIGDAGVHNVDRKNQTITLPDGRLHGFAEYGNPKGTPVFYFHGQPGNRLFRHPDEVLTASLGVRLICPERPGYGLSTFQPGRRLVDWPNDVARLADALGIGQFSVLGFSAGGPYALACARFIPTRLRGVGIISGAPPTHIPELRKGMNPALWINYALFRYAKPLLYLSFCWYWLLARRNPKSFIETMMRGMPEADRKVVSRPEAFALLEAVWEENLRVDSRGYVYDAEILFKPWGFEVSEINPVVHLWWGEEDDAFIRRGMGYLAEHLPNNQAHAWREAGHFGWVDRWGEVLGLISSMV